MTPIDPTTYPHRIAKIAKRFSFDAAHFLTGLPADHPCSRMHGHTYGVELQLIGPIDPKTGFAGADYADIAKAWREIRALVDHRVLNEVPGLEQPTTENLAWWLIGHLAKHPLLSAGEVTRLIRDYPADRLETKRTTLLSTVRVKESSTTWCEVDVDSGFAGITPWCLWSPEPIHAEEIRLKERS
jgi:6-pyruvoyltetrahydropterin/6-carboxytetrahydropterin synthase